MSAAVFTALRAERESARIAADTAWRTLELVADAVEAGTVGTAALLDAKREARSREAAAIVVENVVARIERMFDVTNMNFDEAVTA